MSSDEIEKENLKTINKTNSESNYKENHQTTDPKNFVKCKKIGSYVLSISISYIILNF